MNFTQSNVCLLASLKQAGGKCKCSMLGFYSDYWLDLVWHSNLPMTIPLLSLGFHDSSLNEKIPSLKEQLTKTCF